MVALCGGWFVLLVVVCFACLRCVVAWFLITCGASFVVVCSVGLVVLLGFFVFV